MNHVHQPAPAAGAVAFGVASPTATRIPLPKSWQQLPLVPLAFTLALLALLALPRVHTNPNVAWAVAGSAGFLLAWTAFTWFRRRGRTDAFPVEFVPIPSHWAQACVHLSIILYWGYFWREVYHELPLILAQIFFLYALEGLVSWARGWTWRLGFGPLPIIFSTNLLLWFVDDWFFLQFVMVGLGQMGKQLITWNLPDRRGHVFNPSAFGQTLMAIGLIATGTTKELTLGPQIASTFEAPNMLVVIFLGGLVVQYFFRVTLMTLSAVATLCLINLIYTWHTGAYVFVNISIAAPIFLGLHLLVTDPSTSPRSNLGKVIFGSAYALGYTFLFRALDVLDIPIFWDKLLPVPILNLCVPLIDRLCRRGVLQRLDSRWADALPVGKLNLVHMGCWTALFCAMMFSGFAHGKHPGDSIAFWKQAVVDQKPYAARSLAMAAASQVEANINVAPEHAASAFNELGLLSLEGKGVPQNRAAAAQSFAQACELGNLCGCENVAIQLLFLGEGRSAEDVERAFSQLEGACNARVGPKSCYLLGAAYEIGRGRPRDLHRAVTYYELCGPSYPYAVKGLARIALSDPSVPIANMNAVAAALMLGSQQGDAECSWYAAHLFFEGRGVQADPERGRMYLERACQQNSAQACQALRSMADSGAIPPFTKPVMVVPGWSTDYPVAPQATSP